MSSGPRLFFDRSVLLSAGDYTLLSVIRPSRPTVDVDAGLVW
ncbi:hypothetical protein CLV88_106131 [Shimia abyssi]|uniref:Uncharacterized protein n=1 Tax=Shimia abyssi TaxID=1662395 RepID=A0A2P8FCK6_9RHOB|nr:hypothetical protein CLV88_106131 [Shimia abyssi]